MLPPAYPTGSSKSSPTPPARRPRKAVSDRDTALTSTTALKGISGKSVDPWLLVRRGRESADSAQDESLFALANGTLGVRGGIEEAGSPTQGCFLSGVWERTEIE